MSAPAIQRLETEYFSEKLIGELVVAAAENEGLVKAREATPTLPLQKLLEAFEVACFGALKECAGMYLKDGVTVDDLMAADGPFLILMTLEGQGVGIWDGSWDEFFDSPKTDISAIGKHLEQRLAYFADCTGDGVIPEGLRVAARLSLDLSACGREKGHKCPVCGARYSDKGAEKLTCTNCNYPMPEQISQNYTD